MKETFSDLNHRIDALQPDLIQWRRHLHENPELSFEEFETAAYVAEKLETFGYEVQTRIGGTGVLGTMTTGRPGPCIAFRADMDALPVVEATGLPFESKHCGIMHACGHDAHMAVLLGTAKVLSDLRTSLNGTIKIIFQPGEEANGGAKCMIDGDVLENPKAEAIFALHIMPAIPAGFIGIKSGFLSATDDIVVINVHGIAAHSSEPEKGVNAIMIAANILTSLQSIKASSISPYDITTFDICKIRGGEAENVIADAVEMTGMIRCIDRKNKLLYRERIERICRNTALALGGSADIDFIEGFPAVYNDPSYNELLKAAASEVLGGEQQIVELQMPHLGSEDFSYYQEVIPGVIFLLGVGAAGEDRGELHSPILNLHEDSLACGVKVFMNTALKLCGR
jgi:amidohydrolase